MDYGGRGKVTCSPSAGENLYLSYHALLIETRN